MLRVEQRQLWRPDDHPDGPQRGDCLRACVASVFELDYDQVPDLRGYTQPLRDWLRETVPGVGLKHQLLGVSDPYGCETLDDWRNWPTEHYEQGFWIATV